MPIGVAFTDATIDVQGLRPGSAEVLSELESEVGVPLARLNQVHGADVLVVDEPTGLSPVPEADALVSATRGLGLMIRVADCVPVLLADPQHGVIGAVHAGRPGLALDIATAAVERMRALGAQDIIGWLGPHVCGGCYEVPEAMRTQVAAVAPSAFAQSTWGTPSLDIGAGVRSQLEKAGVDVIEIEGCTCERADLHSYRRDGAAAGRMAGLVWMS